jgi:hypothetical protein
LLPPRASAACPYINYIAITAAIAIAIAIAIAATPHSLKKKRAPPIQMAPVSLCENLYIEI